MTYLCNAVEVPAFCVRSPALLTKLQREDLGLKQLSEDLKLDPGLCARLLHLANSPFFGVSRQISSLNEALIVLGLNRTRSLVQAELLRASLLACAWKGFPLRAVWHCSLRMAATCEVLAQTRGLSDASGFTLGLFHNLGVLVLAQQEDDYTMLLAGEVMGPTLARIEQNLFKTDHGALGAELLATWNFPTDVCEAIGMQYAAQPAFDPMAEVLGWAHQLEGSGQRSANLPVDEALQARILALAQGWIELAGEV